MGALCSGQGDRQRALKLFMEADEIYQDLGDQWLGSNILNEVAWENWNHGNLRKGRELMEGLLTAHREANLKWNISWILSNLSLMTLVLGDYSAAQAYAMENLELRRSFSLANEEAWGQFHLGRVELALGNLDQARQYLSAALKTFRKNQKKIGVSLSLNFLGQAAVHEGDIEKSLALLEESRETCTGLEKSSDLCIVENLLFLGLAVLLQGDYTRAAALLNESLQRVWTSYSLPNIPTRLEGLAAWALENKQYTYSAVLHGAAHQQRQALGAPIFPVNRSKYQETLAQLQSLLPEADFLQAWEMGTAMSVEESVTYALQGSS